MTPEELYNEFNVLYDNALSNQAFPLDAYEISLFFTLAQQELVMALYKGSPITGASFEGTEEARRYIANLIRNYEPVEDTTYKDLLSPLSKAYDLPDNILVLTHEYANIISNINCFDGKRIKIIPILQDEVSNILDNPFKRPDSNKALRLDLSSTKVEIISKYDIKYKIRYLEKPEPIILKDLTPEGVSIDGKTEIAGSQLHSSLDRILITMAVQLAKTSYGK